MNQYKVDATLRYGRNMPKYIVAICIGGVALSCGMTILLIVCWVVYRELILVLTIIFPLIESVCLVLLLRYIIKAKREIALWIKDAELVNAYCERTKCSIEKTNGAINISVTFQYKGITMTKASGLDTDSGPYIKTGYSKWFRRYENKQIKILYSPKYDEVMILSTNN